MTNIQHTQIQRKKIVVLFKSRSVSSTYCAICQDNNYPSGCICPQIRGLQCKTIGRDAIYHFDNQIHIPIATLESCNAKQYECTGICRGCVYTYLKSGLYG